MCGSRLDYHATTYQRVSISATENPSASLYYGSFQRALSFSVGLTATPTSSGSDPASDAVGWILTTTFLRGVRAPHAQSTHAYASCYLLTLRLHILDREDGIEPPVISPLKRYRREPPPKGLPIKMADIKLSPLQHSLYSQAHEALPVSRMVRSAPTCTERYAASVSWNFPACLSLCKKPIAIRRS